MFSNFTEKKAEDSILGILTAINTYLDKTKYTKPLFPFENNILLEIGAKLILDKYRPEDYFSEDEKKSYTLGHNIPDVEKDVDYTLLCMNIADEFSKFRSMREGGVAFEDPFFTFLACFNTGKWKKLFVVPWFPDAGKYWAARTTIIHELKSKKYLPYKYFAIGIPIVKNYLIIPFRYLKIKGGDLDILRNKGSAVLALKNTAGIATYTYYQPI